MNSLQDRVYRKYLNNELKIEVEKAKLQFLSGISPLLTGEFTEAKKAHLKSLQETMEKYVANMLHMDSLPDSSSEQEEKMRRLYEEVVSKAKLTIKQTKAGKLEVSGTDQLL